MRSKIAVAFGLAGLACGTAQAALFTDPLSIVDPNVVTFDAFDDLAGQVGYINVGLAETGYNVFFASTPTSTLGAPYRSLQSNGVWNSSSPIGHVSSADDRFVSTQFMHNKGSISFDFTDGPVRQVGAFVNYLRNAPTTGALTVSALDAEGAVLETYKVSIDTPNGVNAGGFFGISRMTADIFGFVVTDGNIVLDDLSFSAPIPVVPEPQTYLLLGGGLAFLGFVRARRNRA